MILHLNAVPRLIPRTVGVRVDCLIFLEYLNPDQIFRRQVPKSAIAKRKINNSNDLNKYLLMQNCSA